MNALQRRFKSVLERVGDGFTVGGSERKGVFAVLPLERVKDYLTLAEVDAAGRPIRFAYVPYDDPTAANDSVSGDGLSLTVKRAVAVRAKGVTVVRMLVLV
jgi:hypothetical protein